MLELDKLLNYQKETRVRFSPSSTCFMHVGNARIVLFNWLFAQQHQGQFIVRFEDADLLRPISESENHILEDLKWLGITWDESFDRGGAYGPYRQSERIDKYDFFLQQLIEKGFAYPCFCSDEDLQDQRICQIKQGIPPHYDGNCYNMGRHHREELMNRETPYVWRFRIPSGTKITFLDLIKGEVSYHCDNIGDFVIIRQIGEPSYNFSAVIDDHLMRISHVIRSEDHLSNTVIQLMLYQALNLKPPKFAHLPTVKGLAGESVSIRAGSLSITNLRQAGYLPVPICNYLAHLGWKNNDNLVLRTMEQLIEEFDLNAIRSSPANFDQNKLEEMNAQFLSACSYETIKPYLAPFLAPIIDEAQYKLAWRLFQSDISNLADLEEKVQKLVTTPEFSEVGVDLMKETLSVEVIECLEEKLTRTEEWNASMICESLDEVKLDVKIEESLLSQIITTTLTGEPDFPDVVSVMLFLGKDETLNRLKVSRTVVRWR